jgi:hypothetical protein
VQSCEPRITPLAAVEDPNNSSEPAEGMAVVDAPRPPQPSHCCTHSPAPSDGAFPVAGLIPAISMTRPMGAVRVWYVTGGHVMS